MQVEQLAPVAKAAGAALGLLVAVEHTARVFGCPSKHLPSSRLTQLYGGCKSGWIWIGNRFARLSSYLVYLKFGELWVSIVAIADPLVRLTLSPRKLLVGYGQALSDAYSRQRGLVLAGSVGLVVGVALITRRFGAASLPTGAWLGKVTWH